MMPLDGYAGFGVAARDIINSVNLFVHRVPTIFHVNGMHKRRVDGRLAFDISEITMVSLHSLMIHALHAEPTIRLIYPMGKHGYTPLFGYVSDDLAVLRIAAEIEFSVDEILIWYTSVKIQELGDITAQALVGMGQTDAVVNFLTSIRDGERE